MSQEQAVFSMLRSPRIEGCRELMSSKTGCFIIIWCKKRLGQSTVKYKIIGYHLQTI